MAKVADYYISEAIKNPERTHIVSLKTHVVNEDNSFNTAGEIVQRNAIVQNIERGITYLVIYKQGDKWYWGKKVEIYDYEGTEYLRTDKDKITADNLDNLP